MIHVVQTEGPHAEFPYPASREEPAPEPACRCGAPPAYWHEMGYLCARCAGPYAMTAIMIPIEAKQRA
jgi:hypothetical protein